MRFYDRTSELNELARIRETSESVHSQLTVVTGRRRIGKTSLITKSTEAKRTLYLFVSRDNETVLVQRFARDARATLGIFIPDGVSSFRDFFTLVMEAGKTTSFDLVIDEFHEFMYVNKAIMSHIQDVWDRYRKKTHVNLIVSGSAYRMMNEIFEREHEPLFGRRDALLRLRPFATGVLQQILHDHNPDYNNDDLLALYAFTGGVAKYVELFMDNGVTTRESMIDFMVRENSQFTEEGKNILVDEFGKEYGTYFSILGCIASGINTQPDIEAALGGISIGGNLARLIEDYSLVKRLRPYGSKPSGKQVRFEIEDEFLRMWFRYFHRNRTIVELRNWLLLKMIIKEDYETYSGLALERFFRIRMQESMAYSEISSWWDAKGYIDANGNHQQGEIDIIAVSADDKRMTLCEVKRNRSKFKRKLLEEKVAFLKTRIPAIQRYEIDFDILSLEDLSKKFQ